MVPKFLTPIPLCVEPEGSQSGLKPTSAAPPIDPVQHAEPPEARPLPRGQQGDAVRYSNYLPMAKAAQGHETIEPPMADKADPRKLSAFAVPAAPRPTFGLVATDAVQPKSVSTLQFGPLNIVPTTMPEPPADTRLPPWRAYVPAPTVVRFPFSQLTVTPASQGNGPPNPVAEIALAKPPVIEQAYPFVPLSRERGPVIEQRMPTSELPTSIVPFVIVQELPKADFVFSGNPPVSQTLIFRVIAETNASPSADLGPPEVAER
jgi:hypothetical protein